MMLGVALGLAIAEAVFHYRGDGAFPHLNVYEADAQLGARLRPGASRRVSFGGNPTTAVRITGVSADIALRLIAGYGRRIAVPRLATALQPADGLQATAALQLSRCSAAPSHSGAASRCCKAKHHLRRKAHYALAHLRDRDARGAEGLIACLGDQRELPAIRGLCAEGLDVDGPRRRRAVAAALRGLGDASPEVRFWCAFALRAMRVRRALPALRRAAATDDAMLRGWWRVSSEARDAIASIEGWRVRPRRHSGQSASMLGVRNAT